MEGTLIRPKAIDIITREMMVASTTQTRGKKETMEHFVRRLTHLKLEGNARRRLRKIEHLQGCRNLKV